MPIELRPIEPDEFPAFARAVGAAFGDQPTDEQIERMRSDPALRRNLAAIEDGDIVGAGGIYSFELTVPGRQAVPAAGVTWIGVLPTHRRRGILTSIMRRQIDDMREREEPVAMLYASESRIYGRYGYGVAIRHATYQIDTRHGTFVREPETPGRIRLLDKQAAAEALPDVFERFRLQQPGALSRDADYWERYLRDPEDHRHGAGARFYAAYEPEPGQIDGYLPYRIKESWEQGFPANTLRIHQVIAHSPQARFALWRYCLNVDLVTTVEVHDAPSEEPVRWMLADFRRLRMVDLFDGLWVRLVDIPAALAGRRYGATGRIVFGVTDRFYPGNDGRYELACSPDGAECRRTSASPDLELDITDLSAAFLGGVRFGTLFRALRVVECTPQAAHRADLMFAPNVTPWCTQGF
jgi:predicted acetyltransferase